MSASNQQQQEIAPDVPEMRSVLIRSAPSMPAPRSLQFSKQSQFQLKSAPAVVASAETSWKLSSLPRLPEMYPLERSHTYIKGTEGSEVATRIAECLRKESIVAKFDNNKAVAETPCHTQFYVKLFEDNEQVIVEVQRSRGCSFKFSQCSKAILRAAKGAQPVKKPKFTIPASVLSQKVEETQVADAVQIAWGLVSSKGSDTVKLGMESLLQLSMENKLQLDNEKANVIVTHVKANIADDALEFDAMIRRDALTVLANCMANKSVDIKTVVDSDSLVQTLISDLTDDDLHTSYQAARCLTAICQTLPKLKEIVSRLGARTAVASASLQGKCRHALLEKEAQLLSVEMEQ